MRYNYVASAELQQVNGNDTNRTSSCNLQSQSQLQSQFSIVSVRPTVCSPVRPTVCPATKQQGKQMYRNAASKLQHSNQINAIRRQPGH